MRRMKQVDAGVLSVTFDDLGPGDGPAVVLLHGFPYDVHSYGEVAPALAEAGCRVIVPYLCGYGPTRFLSSETPRSGEQAALGADLHALMQALGLRDAVLAGYDWGGRAACGVAALWPAQVRGLVSCCGYNIQDIAGSGRPAAPEQEHRLWYQILLPRRAGPRRAGRRSRRRRTPALGIVVPDVALRPAGLCPNSGRVRQSGFHRGGHPLLPAPLRPHGRRPGLRAH